MLKKFTILFIAFITIIINSCSQDVEPQHTQIKYQGCITQNDPLNETGYYYHKYYIAWSSSWKFELQSEDEITLFLNATDVFTTEMFNYSTKNSLKLTEYIPGGSYIYIRIHQNNSAWKYNEYQAHYVLKATLQ